jgi:F-type H+-transporting ATPase subunit gamma
MAYPAGFKAYEMEDDVVKDLSEFALANALFAALVEGHAAETNARCVMTN